MLLLNLSFILLLLFEKCSCHGKQQMSKVQYRTIVKYLRGEFDTPVCDRSKEEKSALVRLWRNRNSHTLDADGKTLLCDGKFVVMEGKMEKFIKRQFHEMKGTGPRKLKTSLSLLYSGVSEDTVHKTLIKTREYALLKAKFNNKPTIKPIRARGVQSRHQIDLVNMSKLAVGYKGKAYKYVLSIMDIFSRFVWLRPLPSKQSKEGARQLKSVYIEHGAPVVIQHDQGKEFDGAVRRLMHYLGGKIIKSRPYHPQSQGKIERMHRQLK